MYPERELKTLAANKAGLQRIAARHRHRCAAAAVRLTRPLVWLDDARVRWHRLAPVLKLTGLALALFARRPTPARRRVGLGRWVRWGLTVFGLGRGWGAVRRQAGADAD